MVEESSVSSILFQCNDDSFKNKMGCLSTLLPSNFEVRVHAGDGREILQK